ncbi:sulfate transporter [Thermocrinis albus DSM 14484]|uniref:Sulfate transporter n=1 Tax=Thermocrinis albus (strain DSM 14484 / JCM 11386 / HI 11/12) TaxID=638303 RepID=D3SPR7_THEAH|nr:SulP family inorganic anion transporter [Thermocrinis albus]ADC89154.1 sulfate transporter [Thermocrinis albus DSM 14484]
MLEWFKNYGKDKFVRDLVAGITVATVLVPQSMAYALLAGMPPIYGLYASFLPTIVAAVFGSSRFLGTGPVAITSMVSASVLAAYAQPQSQEWIHLAAYLAIMAGLIRLLIGVFKLGSAVELISSSVILGVTSAAAIVISLSQIGSILGFSVKTSTLIYEVLVDIISKIHNVNPYTLMVGTLSFLSIWALGKLHPLIPAALITSAVSSLVSYFFNLKEKGVAIVGDVPAGLPTPYIPPPNLDILADMWAGAVVVVAVGSVEAIATAKTFAQRVGDKWDANREFIGQGLANIVAGIFRGFPVSGSFSRSALNFRLNAASPLAGVITGSIVGLTLLFLAPLFYYLPKATLSAVVLSAVVGLIKPQEILKLYKINKPDGVVAGLTFASVFFMELWQAVLLGILVSLGTFVYKTMYPRIIVMTRDPKSRTFVNAERTGLPQCPQILYIRPGTSIYFGNAGYIQEFILQKVKERLQEGGLKFVLLDMEDVAYIDAPGALMLVKLAGDIRGMGVEPSLANIRCTVYPVLERINITEHVDTDLIFDSKGQSIVELFRRIDHTYCAKVCPYVVFDECTSVKEKRVAL